MYDLQLLPNPANNDTELKFELNSMRILSVEIYNLLGQSVYELPKQTFWEGTHSMQLNTSYMESGMSKIKLSDGTSSIKKILLIANII